jgi:Mn2+/Fe2+ NRAMP family transporter
LTRISIDTTVGMIFSNVIAYFIILATRARCMRMASQTFKQPATRQKPCDPSLEISPSCSLRWGSLALAIPVLAGSGAYVVAELFGWPSTLEAKFPEAIGFYAIIFAATVIGFAMGFLPINPIQLLVWTAVINGIVAAPIMAMMMLIVSNRSAMGRFQARPSLAWAGWGATALMGITVAALLWPLLP